jgi:hypothetical protein
MEARRVSMWRGRNMSDDFFPLVRVIYLFVLGASVWGAEGGFFFQYLGCGCGAVFCASDRRC